MISLESNKGPETPPKNKQIEKAQSRFMTQDEISTPVTIKGLMVKNPSVNQMSMFDGNNYHPRNNQPMSQETLNCSIEHNLLNNSFGSPAMGSGGQGQAFDFTYGQLISDLL
jgi:hypothetical protein